MIAVFFRVSLQAKDAPHPVVSSSAKALGKKLFTVKMPFSYAGAGIFGSWLFVVFVLFMLAIVGSVAGSQQYVISMGSAGFFMETQTPAKLKTHGYPTHRTAFI